MREPEALRHGTPGTTTNYRTRSVLERMPPAVMAGHSETQKFPSPSELCVLCVSVVKISPSVASSPLRALPLTASPLRSPLPGTMRAEAAPPLRICNCRLR
jgi:hypothetical protein